MYEFRREINMMWNRSDLFSPPVCSPASRSSGTTSCCSPTSWSASSSLWLCWGWALKTLILTLIYTVYSQIKARSQIQAMDLHLKNQMGTVRVQSCKCFAIKALLGNEGILSPDLKQKQEVSLMSQEVKFNKKCWARHSLVVLYQTTHAKEVKWTSHGYTPTPTVSCFWTRLPSCRFFGQYKYIMYIYI